MSANRDNIFCSVVMPVFNGDRFLKQAVESILNQTYCNFELIIVDNGSSDKSMEIINQFEDNRIKIVHESTRGAINAYNSGFKVAKGDFIFLMDQDDLSSTGRIENQLYYIEHTQSDITGSYFNIIDVKNNIRGKRKLPVYESEISQELVYKNWTIFNPTVCIRRRVFQEAGYFNEEHFPSADYEFYLRMSKKYRLSNISEYLYSWRLHNDQISNRYKIDVQRQCFQISRQYVERWKDQIYYSSYWITMGKIYYYNNYLTKALMCFIKSVFIEKSKTENIRYITLIILFWLPIKMGRRFDWTDSRIFVQSKNIFDNLFNHSK